MAVKKSSNDVALVHQTAFLKNFVRSAPFLGLLGLVLGGGPGLLIGLAAGVGVALTAEVFAGAMGSGPVNLLYGLGKNTSTLRERLACDLNIVRYHKMNQNFDLALAGIDEVLAQDADFAEALLLKAQILRQGFEDDAGAGKCLQRIIAVEPDRNSVFHRWAVNLLREMAGE